MSSERSEGNLADDSQLARPLGDVSVSRRGGAAMFYVISWGLANLAITFLGSLVLARLLTPRDFGLVALGQTVAMLSATVTEGGIASAFIRQREGISHAVLRSINGVQLLIASTMAAVVTPVALRFGLAGSLAAVIVWSLPVVSLQTSGRVVLNRDLRFRSLAIVDVTGVLSYYVWSIVGVLAGYGVWSLASGIVIRAAVSTAALGVVLGWRILIPSLARYRVVLGAIGFGIRFSLHTLTNVLYEQTRNIIIALIGGTQALGLWVLAVRLLQIPSLMFQPIHSIAFPAFSQFIATGRNARPLLERVAALTFAASSLVLPAFLVASPGFIATVLGPQWEDAALVFPGILLSMFIGIPVASVSIQFLYASGKPAAVLWVTLAAVLVNLVCISVLFWLIGLPGVGFGTVPGAALESFVFSRIVHRMNGAELLSAMPRFLVASLVAIAAGLGVASAIESDALAALLGGTVAVAVAAIVCVVVAKSLILDLVGVARRSVSTALAGER